MIPLLALAAIEWITVPASQSNVTDPLSGIPVTVTVDAFAMTKTEISRQEFETLMRRKLIGNGRPQQPATHLSWLDAVAYANAASLRDRLPACYDRQGQRIYGCMGYRLPTEAEWQAAAGAKPPAGAWFDAAEPRDVGAGPPAANGFHDLYGNVWEWCEDWFAANQSPWPVRNPRGPLRGLERVIRGGGAITKNNGWARGFRASRDPRRGHEWTGFRLARSLEPTGPRPQATMRASRMNETWAQALGIPQLESIPPPPPAEQNFDTPWFHARLQSLPTESGSFEKILVLDGDHANPHPRPVLIVPYYDVDTPAGLDLGGRNYQPLGVRSYAWLAAQQGWIAVAIRWFGESYGERYDEAVEALRRRHPEASGLGKWVHDAKRLLDWMERQPRMDRTRIAMMGHSLGGKMTLYAAAFDSRIQAAVASEPGISLKFSNWGDPWYWGSRLSLLPKDADHDDLLRAIAPRPFLLIGGEDSDGEKSRAILDKAGPGTFDFINHRKGHTPTPESIGEAMRWLARHLD